MFYLTSCYVAVRRLRGARVFRTIGTNAASADDARKAVEAALASQDVLVVWIDAPQAVGPQSSADLTRFLDIAPELV